MLLTTQHLDEAEELADRIDILHGGRIIPNGTLAELKRLLPPPHGRVRREAADPGGRLPRPVGDSDKSAAGSGNTAK